ncbi:MAG: ureidoglycolate lyase [Treponema sp.]|jgi:ureidoglycolate hydrolase|nr:ureidoglycolate lyase [Treponema sp.]
MEIKKIKACKVTEKNFAPFGQYISTKNRKADSANKVFSFWNSLGAVKIKGETSICIVKTLPQKQMREDGMEHHKKTSEVLVAAGDMVVVAALSDDANPKFPDPAKVKAFVVPGGDAVIFSPGVWHHAPLALKEACNVYVIFDKTTPDKDFYYVDLAKQFGFNWEIAV